PVLAAEHPEVSVYWVDPGDMRTRMHPAAFPGEDISDRPPPDASVPGTLAPGRVRPPRGRYVATADRDAETTEPRRARPRRRRRRLRGGTTAPLAADLSGEVLRVLSGGSVHLLTRYGGSTRLWAADVDLGGPVVDGLADHGHPIRYGYVPEEWPIEAYQTVFG